MVHVIPDGELTAGGLHAEPGRPIETPEQALDRLRDQHPGWQIEYADGKAVPWIAIRRRHNGWVGGHPVCEAQDPSTLEYLISRATETESKVVAISERERKRRHADTSTGGQQ